MRNQNMCYQERRDDLLEDPAEAEVREMEAATLAALEAVDGPGWRVVRVGGGQRGLPSHDADFVVTHDTDPDRWAETGSRVVNKAHVCGMGLESCTRDARPVCA